MGIKKFLAVIAAAAFTFTMGVTAFADDSPAEEELEAVEGASVEDEIRNGEGYYECHIIYHEGIPQIYSEDGDLYEMVGEIDGHVQEGETRESIEKDAAESIRNGIIAAGADPDDHGFEVYVYFYDDYDYTPTEFLNFISEDIARRESERTSQTEDNIDDNELAAEEVPLEDEIRRGEGYYECHIIYHNGAPQIYSEDGNLYAMVGTIGGHVKEGETRESIEKDAAESIRNEIAATGADPDDYGFEVYVYFYDDYDYTPIEFLDFIFEDIARRESERTSQPEEVPNPVTGNSFPYGAVILSAAALSCMRTANSPRSAK